jgi:hypothetical protein
MNAQHKIPPTEQRRSAMLRFGRAWVGLAGALAIHGVDEALTNFLSVYNPAVRTIRERFPWLPLPTFSFGVWIGGLAAGIVLLFALSPLAFRGVRWIVVFAMPFSVMMAANGLGHVGSSIYTGRFMPGVYSSPVLVAASLIAFICAWRLARLQREKA